ncbi:MAG TPA: hypothetical protein VNN76_11395 [Bacteroidota bacterium]|nr:hypothetical protein [Bacteroidota bacterium]
MSFKTRNTLVLIAAWIIIGGGGFAYSELWQGKELEELERIQRDLNNLPVLKSEVELLRSRNLTLKDQYANRKKIIPPTDQASLTHDYITRAIDQAGKIKLDMKYVDGKELREWGYNRYSLAQGESRFESFYKFIYAIENGPRPYKIQTLKLSQDEIGVEMKFDLTLEAYYSQVAGAGVAEAKPLTHLPNPPHNPFTPFITGPSRESRLVDAETAELQGIILGKAYMRYRNRTVVLQVGDRVQNGMVTSIDAAQGRVVFTITEDGKRRRVEKRIQFENK